MDFDTRSFQSRDFSSTEREFGLVFIGVDELSGDDFGDMKRNLFKCSLDKLESLSFKEKSTTYHDANDTGARVALIDIRTTRGIPPRNLGTLPHNRRR